MTTIEGKTGQNKGLFIGLVLAAVAAAAWKGPEAMQAVNGYVSDMAGNGKNTWSGEGITHTDWSQSNMSVEMYPRGTEGFTGFDDIGVDDQSILNHLNNYGLGLPNGEINYADINGDNVADYFVFNHSGSKLTIDGEADRLISLINLDPGFQNLIDDGIVLFASKNGDMDTTGSEINVSMMTEELIINPLSEVALDPKDLAGWEAYHNESGELVIITPGGEELGIGDDEDLGDLVIDSLNDGRTGELSVEQEVALRIFIEDFLSSEENFGDKGERNLAIILGRLQGIPGSQIAIDLNTKESVVSNMWTRYRPRLRGIVEQIGYEKNDINGLLNDE